MEWNLYPISMFESRKQDWDELNSRNGNTPLLDSRFVLPLLKNFGTGKEKLAICTNESRVCCMAIVYKKRSGTWETFQPSQAPIGAWIQETELSTEKLACSLRSKLPGAWLVLGITQQDPSLLTRPEPSRSLDTLDYIATAHVPVVGTFEEYWAKRGKNLRQNLRRQRNRLAREDIHTELSIIKDVDSIHGAVKAYGELESAGWKNESNTAIHIDNSQGHFYEKILQNFAKTGDASIFQYRYNGELVATDFCIVGGGSFIILKTTYDESITTSSPAMLMREDAFNYIFSGQIAERIEFYGKVMDWHKRWAEDIRTMYHINFFSLLGALISRLRH